MTVAPLVGSVSLAQRGLWRTPETPLDERRRGGVAAERTEVSAEGRGCLFPSKAAHTSEAAVGTHTIASPRYHLVPGSPEIRRAWSNHPTREMLMLSLRHANAAVPAAHRTYQYWLDRSVIYTTWRWVGFFVSLMLFMLRIYVARGWFIVTYGLGIFLLNNLIGFLSPQVREPGVSPKARSCSASEYEILAWRCPPPPPYPVPPPRLRRESALGVEGDAVLCLVTYPGA